MPKPARVTILPAGCDTTPWTPPSEKSRKTTAPNGCGCARWPIVRLLALSGQIAALVVGQSGLWAAVRCRAGGAGHRGARRVDPDVAVPVSARQAVVGYRSLADLSCSTSRNCPACCTLTGGITNPFALLIMAPVAVAAMALRPRSTLVAVAVAIALITLVSAPTAPCALPTARCWTQPHPDLRVLGGDRDRHRVPGVLCPARRGRGQFHGRRAAGRANGPVARTKADRSGRCGGGNRARAGHAAGHHQAGQRGAGRRAADRPELAEDARLSGAAGGSLPHDPAVDGP